MSVIIVIIMVKNIIFEVKRVDIISMLKKNYLVLFFLNLDFTQYFQAELTKWKSAYKREIMC